MNATIRAIAGAATVTAAASAARSAAGELRDDTFAYLDNGIVRLGLDVTKGGSIGWFSATGANSTNFVNIHDFGREVQGSFYSGPANYNPNNLCDPPGYDPFPWNPIGAGDFYGHSTAVLNLTISPDQTRAVIISRPLQWACNNVPCECTFTKTIALVGNAAEVTLTLANARSDPTQYPPFNQELPAVYTVGMLCNQWGYIGSEPFSGPPTQLPLQDRTAMQPLYLVEHWLAFVGADGVGLGLFHPTVVNFGTMYYLSAGTSQCAGGPYNDTTGYMSAWTDEILDASITYTYNFSLVYGDVAQIRAYAQSKMVTLPPSPQYVFTSDRQHFTYNNAVDTWPVVGAINVTMPTMDPQVIGPLDYFVAEQVPTIYVTAAYSPNQHDSQAQLFFQPNGTAAFNATNVVNFDIVADGTWHTYSVPMAGATGYAGSIARLRMDPVVSGQSGAYVLIACIARVPECATPAIAAGL